MVDSALHEHDSNFTSSCVVIPNAVSDTALVSIIEGVDRCRPILMKDSRICTCIWTRLILGLLGDADEVVGVCVYAPTC